MLQDYHGVLIPPTLHFVQVYIGISKWIEAYTMSFILIRSPHFTFLDCDHSLLLLWRQCQGDTWHSSCGAGRGNPRTVLQLLQSLRCQPSCDPSRLLQLYQGQQHCTLETEQSSVCGDLHQDVSTSPGQHSCWECQVGGLEDIRGGGLTEPEPPGDQHQCGVILWLWGQQWHCLYWHQHQVSGRCRGSSGSGIVSYQHNIDLALTWTERKHDIIKLALLYPFTCLWWCIHHLLTFWLCYNSLKPTGC